MKPGKIFPRNSERKNNFSRILPHAVEINRAVEISRFNRTSTALQPHFNRKVLERSLQELNTM